SPFCHWSARAGRSDFQPRSADLAANAAALFDPFGLRGRPVRADVHPWAGDVWLATAAAPGGTGALRRIAVPGLLAAAAHAGAVLCPAVCRRQRGAGEGP